MAPSEPFFFASFFFTANADPMQYANLPAEHLFMSDTRHPCKPLRRFLQEDGLNFRRFARWEEVDPQ
jgi:hypothetical protein